MKIDERKKKKMRGKDNDDDDSFLFQCISEKKIYINKRWTNKVKKKKKKTKRKG
jgi:hypothetical protein